MGKKIIQPSLRNYGLETQKTDTKGRTITSYSSSLLCKLLEIASIAINLMVQAISPQAPDLLPILQIWQELHAFFKQSALPLSVWNDDLVGCFNAVPKSDKLTAVQTSIGQFQPWTGPDSALGSVYPSKGWQQVTLQNMRGQTYPASCADKVCYRRFHCCWQMQDAGRKALA